MCMMRCQSFRWSARGLACALPAPYRDEGYFQATMPTTCWRAGLPPTEPMPVWTLIGSAEAALRDDG